MALDSHAQDDIQGCSLGFCNIYYEDRSSATGRLACVRPESGRGHGGSVERPAVGPDMQRHDEGCGSKPVTVVRSAHGCGRKRSGRKAEPVPSAERGRAGEPCRPRGAAAPDPCAHRGRPRAPGGSSRVHPAGRLGVRLQAAARRRPAGDRLLGPGRLHGPAQRPPAHLRPRLCGRERHRRRRGLGAADDRHLSPDAALGGGDPVGGLARRGDGGRAPGQHRPAQRPGAHRPSPGRAGAAPAGRAGAARTAATSARSTSIFWPMRWG